jgi:hypothetical protein
MRQSVPVLFASVYYTVENLCVRREKLFDKRHYLSYCMLFWETEQKGLLFLSRGIEDRDKAIA